MSAEFIELSAEEMDGLIERIEGALRDGLSLEPADISLILKILRHFAFMQGQLQAIPPRAPKICHHQLEGLEKGQSHFGN